MNPVGTAPIFQNMVSPLPRARQRHAALIACLFIAAILFGSAIAGSAVLHVFGVSIDAFRAAGGVIIGAMGYNMLRGAKSEEHERLADEVAIRENLLIPFAMPLVAGPGTITTMITLATNGTGPVPWVALVAAGAGVVATGLCLLAVLEAGKYFSRDLQRIFTRFMGLILMAMGMQFLLMGAAAVVGSAIPESAAN